MRKSVDVDMMNGMKMTLNINFSSNDEEQPTPTLGRYNSIDRLPQARKSNVANDAPGFHTMHTGIEEDIPGFITLDTMKMEPRNSSLPRLDLPLN